MGRSTAATAAVDLLLAQRWAALATLGEQGEPLASMVAYVVEPELGGLLLHVSRLAAHTGNLLARPAASLVVGESDPGAGDPQQLARLTLAVRAAVIPRDSDTYARARALYSARLPDAQRLFDFPDFVLFRLALGEARYVGGFARAFTLTVEDLRRAASTRPGLEMAIP